MRLPELHRTLFPYWKPYRRRLLMGLFFLFGSSSLLMVQPWIMKLAIDDLGTDRFTQNITKYIWGILAVTLLVCLFRFLMRWLIIGVSRRVEHDVRRAVFQHVMVLPRTYFDSVASGDVMSRMTNDVQRVRMILGPALMQIGNTLFSLVFALIFMILIDVRLTLLSMIPLPLMPVMFYLMGRKIRYHSDRVQKQIASITSFSQENLTGIRVVKAYNLEQVECDKMKQLSDGYVERNLALVRVQGLFVPLSMFLAGLSTTVVLMLCGWWVIAGHITIGSMVAFLEYLAILSWPMFAIGWVTGLIQQGSAAMQRIQDVLNERPCSGMLPENGVSEHGAVDLNGDITFTQVCFRYRPDQSPILRNLSLAIQKGSSVAVMGASGSGKTTLMHLLTRSYLPESGEVRLNGYRTDELPEFIVREHVGIVPQNIILFSDTIRNNILFGSKNGDDVDFDTILRSVQLDRELSEFPGRIDTRLGERGVNISGGQKQRLTLARMLAREPGIVLLDDPFSSVDIVTEEKILDAVLAKNTGKTVILVTHRVNTARRTDRIFILDNGMVAENGTHEELVEKGGCYSELCRKQSLMDELESL
jgi:ATP-binding cassette, subfamily B, multidrug efflux pump